MRFNHRTGLIKSEKVTHRRFLSFSQLHAERLQAAEELLGDMVAQQVERRYGSTADIRQSLETVHQRAESHIIESWFEDWLIERRFVRSVVPGLVEHDARVVSSTLELYGEIIVVLEFVELEGFAFEGIRLTWGEDHIYLHNPKGIN